MFEEENTLPRAESQASVVNRNDFAGSGQCHAQMAGTVIRAFVSMNEVGEIFGDEVIKEGMKIRPCLRVCVLHDDQAAAGVAHKNSDLSGLEANLVYKVANFA